MLRITTCVAGAWFLIAPLTAVAAPAPLFVPSAGDAVNQARMNQAQTDQTGQRTAQNNAVRTQAPAARKPPQAQGPAQVYLLRGFLNVFSLGMDDLAAKIQADGMSATVMNHADADFIASRILTTYNAGDHGPVVLIGHSLGADAVAEIADTLARYNIPVALLVLFDGTEPHQIPATVATAINYTKHFMIAPEPGSRGAVSNVDLSGDPGIDHLNIDTAPSLQTQVLNYVLQAASPMPRRQ
jgi:pimeloyl-ACP methyl ester carboxylesterase